MYEEHARKLNANDPNDFFDMFILKMSKEDNPDYTVDQLSMIARDLFEAGGETIVTTICWAVIYLFEKRRHSGKAAVRY